MRVILCDESKAHEGIMYPFQIIEKNGLVLLAHKTSVGCQKQVVNDYFGTLYSAERKCNYVTQVILLNFFKLKYASLHLEVMLHDTPLRMCSLHRMTLILNSLKISLKEGQLYTIF